MADPPAGRGQTTTASTEPPGDPEAFDGGDRFVLSAGAAGEGHDDEAGASDVLEAVGQGAE